MATLHFHIVPNAKQDQVVGAHGEAIKIKLRAPAIEGKANAALCDFLAAQMGIARRAIMIQRGQKSREKWLRVEGLSEEEVRRRLGIKASTSLDG